MSLGWIYNLQQYSGLLFQICIDITRKKKTVSEVFAAGGRYDALVSSNNEKKKGFQAKDYKNRITYF